MRGARSFVLAVAAVVAVGGAAAGAENSAETSPPQTLTIEVTSTARTISVDGDVSFSVPQGTVGVDLTDESSTLTFTNPIGAGGDAKIQVRRNCCPNTGNLELTVSIPSGVVTAPSFRGNDTGFKTLREAIPESAEPQTAIITWKLTDNAPLEPTTIVSEFVFVIDNS